MSEEKKQGEGKEQTNKMETIIIQPDNSKLGSKAEIKGGKK